MEFNVELSRYAHERVEAVPRACYWNTLAAWRLPRLRRARYVEGWYTPIIATEHAWLELDGQVIDPTWPDPKHLESNGYAPPVYFPGLRFTRAEARALVGKRRLDDNDVPFFQHFGAYSTADSRMEAAMIEAYGHLYGRKNLARLFRWADLGSRT